MSDVSEVDSYELIVSKLSRVACSIWVSNSSACDRVPSACWIISDTGRD